MKVILFDGVCGFCNRWVNFLMARDHKKVFKFSPIQGQYAQTILSSDDIVNNDSIVFCDEGICVMKSTAILMILKELGGLWGCFRVLLWIPSPLRDKVYDVIAKNRYRWFGQ